jgi:hypothetical protein
MFVLFSSLKVLSALSYTGVSMSIQISVKLSDKMINSAKLYAEQRGFDRVQNLIRELLREKLFDELFGDVFITMASESSLAKHWLTKEEDKAGVHLQKET